MYEYEVLIIVQGTATLHHLALSLAIGLQCLGTIESIVMSVTRRKVGNQVEITEFTRLWLEIIILNLCSVPLIYVRLIVGLV